MSIKEKDQFGDVAVSLAQGRKESDVGEERLGWVWKMRLGVEGGGVRVGGVGGGEGAQWVPEGPWHISGISIRTLPALRYG